ncbi:MAG: hypothetical protein U0931_25275 [Vulcanimicrobiota bacterium]
MDNRHRIVTATPLSELWDRQGQFLNVRRQGDLSASQLQHLLKQEVVRFVVADPGLALLWLDEEDRFRFWKEEVRHRIQRSDTPLSEYPGGYCYQASLWTSTDQSGSVILLEKCH